MKFTANNAHIREAINRIRLDLENAQNKYPFITVLADEKGAAIFATDQLSFIESRIPAVVEGVGFCQVDRKLGQILASVRDEEITLSLSGNRLSITGDRGFKGRLITVSSKEAVPYGGIVEKFSTLEYTFQGCFNKHDLAALLKLSTILPESDLELSPCKYVIIHIQGEEAWGATHESAVGAVESMPLPILRYTTVSPDPIKIVIDSDRLNAIIGICGNEVELWSNAADFRNRIPVKLMDSEGLWWGMIGQMQLRSEGLAQ